jgi:hypothetical protein
MTTHHVACNCCVQMCDLLPCGGGLGNIKEEDKGKNHCDEQAWFWYKCCFCCCLCVSATTSLA